jgi:hypothetical protein
MLSIKKKPGWDWSNKGTWGIMCVIYFSLGNIKEELRPQIYILEWGISFKKEERKNDQDFEAWKQPSKQKNRLFPVGEAVIVNGA